MSGRNVTLTRNRLDAERIATIPMDDLHQGFARAFVEACGSGIRAVKLQSHMILPAVDGHLLITTQENDRLRLEAEREVLARRRRRAKAAYLDAVDDGAAATFKATFDQTSKQLTALEHQLAQLDVAGSQVAAPPEFTADIEVLLTALDGIAAGGRRATREQIRAFEIVVPELRVVPAPDGRWTASATVRLPVEAGVVELGPFSWQVHVANRGVNAVHAARAARPSPLPGLTLTDQVGLLEDSGVPRAGALTVTNAPFPELVQILLHRTKLEQLPDWVGPEWRRPPFIDHVIATYTTPEARSSLHGRYLSNSPERQAILELAAQRGGGLSLFDLRKISPSLFSFADALRKARPARRAVHPWLDPWVFSGERGERRLDAYRCTCGQLATRVVRVPEVPSSLLCRCGRAAGADTSVADLLFPAEYQALAVPEDVWRRRVSDDRGPAAPRLNPATTADAVRRFLAEHHEASTRQIAEHLGSSHQQAYGHLSNNPRVERAGRAGRVDMTWRLVQTDEV